MTETITQENGNGAQELRTTVASAGTVATKSAGGMSRTTRLNDLTSYLLLTVVMFSAIPYGSNRPFFWALWATVVGVIGLYYAYFLFKASASPRRPVNRYPAITLFFALVSGWMLVQALPIGAIWGGSEFVTQTGTSIKVLSLSLAPGETILAFLKWVTYGIMFFLFLQVGARKTRARFTSRMLMYCVTALAIYSFVALIFLNDTLLLSDKTQYFGDLTGTFVNRNSFATFLAMGAVLSAALAIPSSNSVSGHGSARTEPGGDGWALTLQNAVAFACFAIVLSALIATHSRMGTFAGLCGLLVVIFLRLPTNRLRLVAGAIAVAATVTVLAFYGDQLLDRLLFTTNNAQTRLELYKQVLAMIRDRPVLGFGADAFNPSYPLYQSWPVPTHLVFDKAHSTYLTHWSELGLVVGSLPILIVALCAWTVVRCLLQGGTKTVEVCASIGVITVAALHSLVDFSLEIQAVVFLFIAIVALGVTEAFSHKVPPNRH